MKKIQIALVHCPKSTRYQLVKMTKEIDPDDPCVMWIFDSSKINTAKKIMKNMNVAQLLNASGSDVAFA